MSWRLPAAVALVAAGLAVGYRLANPPADRTATSAPTGGRRALLVGVTRYDRPDIPELFGPANDVALLRRLLVERFGFAPADVVCLSEAEGTPDRRPTRANIEREFRRLAEAARPGEQVVVLLSGHGSRQPQPLDPPAPEPDGLDEVFLPADVGPAVGSPARLVNAVVDDELGAWLAAVTARRAHVWAVFDCCHSGTLTRGTERVREVPPRAFIPEAELTAARGRAAARVAAGRVDDRRLLPPAAADQYLTALYACRADETTPELPLPAGAADPRWHGLFTYTVCQTLAGAGSPLTSAELLQRVRTAYAGRAKGGGTPGADGGGRDREVFGVTRWPGRAELVLRRGVGGLTVAAGDLHGLTRGSVLAVDGPAGGPDAGRLLGHVRVVAVELAESRVEPVAFGGRPAPTGLPDLAVGRVAFTDYSAGRFKLWADVPPGPGRDAVLAALNPLTDPNGGMFELADRAAADLVVRADGGRAVLTDAAGERPPLPLGQVADAGFAKSARDNLGQAFRAKTLLAVAARGAAVGDGRLTVEVLRHAFREAAGVPVPADGPGAALRVGERYSCRLTNRGDDKLDVSVLLVGTDYQIEAMYPVQDQAFEPLPAGAARLTGHFAVFPPVGVDRLVVIAGPARPEPADFTVLSQRGLSQTRGGERPPAFDTDLGRVFESALLRTGGTRGGPRPGCPGWPCGCYPFTPCRPTRACLTGGRNR